MKIITKLLLISTFSISFLSCDKKIDNLQLMKDLQVHVDDVMSQGYQISQISIFTKSFSECGPDEVGSLRFMFIDAIPPDSTVTYFANFSYSDNSSELTFHGYPDNLGNEITERTSYFKPNLSSIISKLDEIKKQIPEGYKYDNLLYVKYSIEKNEPEYTFDVELKQTSKDASHPKVKQEKMSYVKYITSRNRKRFGTTKTITTKDITNKTQHTITFRLKGDQIEIQ